MRISYMKTTAFAALVLSGTLSAAILLFAPAAIASTYNLTGNIGAITVDLNFTTSNTLNAYGYDITGITGSVTGHGTVSNFSGTVPNVNDTVSSGLYVDLPGGHTPGTVWTVQNPANSGGANFDVDNVWTSTDPFLTYVGGVAFLLTDGLTGYISDAFPSNSAGQYYLFLGNGVINGNFSATVAQTPLPATWTMMLLGLAGFGFVAFSRKQTSALIAAA